MQHLRVGLEPGRHHDGDGVLVLPWRQPPRDPVGLVHVAAPVQRVSAHVRIIANGRTFPAGPSETAKGVPARTASTKITTWPGTPLGIRPASPALSPWPEAGSRPHTQTRSHQHRSPGAAHCGCIARLSASPRMMGGVRSPPPTGHWSATADRRRPDHPVAAHPRAPLAASCLVAAGGSGPGCLASPSTHSAMQPGRTPPAASTRTPARSAARRLGHPWPPPSCQACHHKRGELR